MLSKEIPLFAQYGRVVVSRQNDKEIKWYEILSVSRQIEMKVNKNQTILNKVSDNVFADVTMNDKRLASDGTTENLNGSKTTEFIEIGEYDSIIAKGVTRLALYDKAKNLIGEVSENIEDGLLANTSSKAVYIRVSGDINSQLYLVKTSK